MIKILLKTILDLIKIVYDVVILALHIIFKIIKITIKILCFIVKKLAKTIKKNREKKKEIILLSGNEYKDEKIPYLNPEEKNKKD